MILHSGARWLNPIQIQISHCIVCAKSGGDFNRVGSRYYRKGLSLLSWRNRSLIQSKVMHLFTRWRIIPHSTFSMTSLPQCNLPRLELYLNSPIHHHHLPFKDGKILRGGSDYFSFFSVVIEPQIEKHQLAPSQFDCCHISQLHAYYTVIKDGGKRNLAHDYVFIDCPH